MLATNSVGIIAVSLDLRKGIDSLSLSGSDIRGASNVGWHVSLYDTLNPTVSLLCLSFCLLLFQHEHLNGPSESQSRLLGFELWEALLP